MTKLKNTKKGMAKKALSISLVAAMLATSNVPVWAAEDIFSSSENAAVETVEDQLSAEDNLAAPISNVAPAVEETDSVEPLSSVVTEGDISVNLTVDKDTVIWGDTATISGSITHKDGGAPVTGGKYRWVDEGGYAVESDDRSDIADMSLVTTSAHAGKVLTLYIYDETPGTANYDINTGIKVTVNKRSLTSVTLNTSSKEYNGFAQDANSSVVSTVTDEKKASVTLTNSDGSTNYAVTSSTATQVGEEITVTVSAEKGSPYIGSISATIPIAKRVYKDKDIVVSTVKEQKFQYTGAAIEIAKDKVILAESKSKDNGKDGKLSGASLNSAIVKAETVAAGVGDQKVTVTIDPQDASIADRFVKGSGSSDAALPTTMDTEETVEITKRDLSTAGTTITVKNGKIKSGIAVSAIAASLKFTGIEGTELDLAASDYSIEVKNPEGTVLKDTDTVATGDYKLTVTAAEKGNCTNSQTIDVSVVGNVLTGAEVSKIKDGSYAPIYNGSAIEPTKSDLGTLTVKGSAGDEVLRPEKWEIINYTRNTDAATYKGEVGKSDIKTQAYVNIKILDGLYKDATYSIPFVIAPLEVLPKYVTVPETISYNKGYAKPEQYNVPVTVVAKEKTTGTPKVEKTLSASDYTVKYAFKDGGASSDTNGTAKNELHDEIQATVTIINTNYIMGSNNGKTHEVPAENTTEIVAKKLTDSMVNVNPSTYTYTGGKIVPTYTVVDGVIVLYKQGEVATGAEYKEVSITDSVNVGTGKIKVEGLDPNYSGTATGTFTITAANTNSVKVEFTNKTERRYTGKQVRPRTFKATLNGNDVSDQFEIVSYGENISGIGTVVLKPVDGNKNFTGENITAEFNIVKEEVEATLKLYDAKGIDRTSSYTATINAATGAVTADSQSAFTFDGNAKTFAKVQLTGIQLDGGGKTTATANDFEIKYVDNISGKKVTTGFANIAHIYVVAKDGTGFAGTKTIVTADGTEIKNVVADVPFSIKSVMFNKQNVTVKNGSYAGGLPVKPEILIQIGGSTLVEGTDYNVKLVDAKGEAVTPTDVTSGNIYGVKIAGKNGYEGSSADSVFTSGSEWALWGVDKKNLNACDVTVKDGVTTVMNGYIPVPATEYESKDNGDGTYTVTANKLSKNYVGSKTVTAEGQKPEDKPVAPTIQQVNVVGNKATVILEGDTEGSTGYDYVISKSKVFSDKASRVGVNANVLSTQTTFRYVDQGVYYAYLHSWKRGADGKKIFSSWSNAYPFVVSSITPDQPTVTSVKVSGKKVTVTYTKTANATGYDLVLGSKVKKVNGEMRPVEYGKLVKKVTKGNVVTATFTNVPKGTYYAGLHAYNRTSENNGKVFSPWSNTKKVTVK